MLREETAANPARQARVLAGLQAYQQAERPQTADPMPVLYRQGRAQLFDYDAPQSDAPVVIVVPSLINPPHILDLTPDTSLLHWLATQGLRPMLLDWGTPDESDRDLDITAHVERTLLPLIASFERPLLVGYCLGGTMALGAASATSVAGVALIAAPWRFTGFGERARSEIADLWRAAAPSSEALGYVPMEVLQAGFWRLDPARTVSKYEQFAAMPADSATARRFVAMEDWANGGAPLPLAFARQLFEDFVGRDMPGRGDWIVAGRPVRPEALTCPAVEFVSRHDRIVPAATAIDLPDRHDLSAGHVGMIVGSGSGAQLREPLADWLRRTAGSKTAP